MKHKPSKHHPNRGLHNWLLYDTMDSFFEKHSGLIKGSAVDLGAGSSPYKSYFLTLADHYLSVDWSDSYHEVDIDIIADLNKPLPLEQERADVVISLSVLEHLHSPQVMLSESHRILRSSGAIILQVPWQWWIHEAPHDYYRYTPQRLKTLLEEAGFIEVTVEPQAGLFTTLTLKLNYFSLRFVRGPGLMRKCARAVLSILWYIGQKTAPLLDRLDSNWSLETMGYFITARKP